MSRLELLRQLREEAGSLGFDALGVARAERLERDGATLERWLDRGQHAGMHWMAREPGRRADPRRLLEGCRSVILLTLGYGPAARAPSGSRLGRVARYAHGRDYHRVLGPKLKRLAAWLDERCGSTSRAFVDTGPVLERAWAERAGLGWIGKNANLLTRERGSWLLLGEILTTAELEPAPAPHAEFCGTCTACLEACPTQAIVADGVVDAGRCIAYWTIEHRGPVPEARRAGIDDWIFGCDVCQEVCPWNRSFGRDPAADMLERRDDLATLDPITVLVMDEPTFRERYSGTALMRAKWEGLRRNACIILGNRGGRDALEPLERALGDSDPVVRDHAAWAISRIAERCPS
jgi:epoxyqueuosine reductase